MKVIDLLNKIANGEHDFTFRYNGYDYFYDFSSNSFIDTEEKEQLGEKTILDSVLNDEVEIIEENKKIRKIKLCYSPDIDEEIFYEDGDKPNHCILGDAGTKLLINKINELIDKINEDK